MLRGVHADDRGIGLITVLMIMLVMSVLVTGILSYGTSSMRQARHDQDWHASVGAADAGIQEFVSRLNSDSAYWQQADPGWADGDIDPDNPALSGWTSIPGGDAHGEYRYSVDASTLLQHGYLTVTATGRVGDTTRTITTQLRRRTFLDYLYFSEYETLNPNLYPNAGLREWAAQNCVRHRYDGRPTPATDQGFTWWTHCQDIYWFGSPAFKDTIRGPFHTNDSIAVSGNPAWLDEATTSDPAAHSDDVEDRFFKRTSVSNPQFRDGDPRHQSPLLLPPSNDQLKAHADPDIGAAGCLYLGPTFFRIQGDQITVKSAQTADPDPLKCPIDGVMEQLPANGVIYVASKEEGSPCSPTPHPYAGAPLMSNDITPYNCRAGDVFIEGELNGKLTVAAENNIYITNHLTYQGGKNGNDILGLVANNFIEIFHPVRQDGSAFVNIHYLPSNRAFRDPVVQAAILSVNQSFQVQNFNRGAPLGTLTVYGAMAQTFRGPTGTFNMSSGAVVSGYAKDYEYDERLKLVSPPHFIDPVQSEWRQISWSEEVGTVHD